MKWFSRSSIDRQRIWKGLISSVVMAILLILALFLLYDLSVPKGVSKLQPTAVLVIFLVGDVWAMIRIVKRIRNSP